MWMNKDWMLCSAGQTVCSVIMTMFSDLITCDFSHYNEKVTPAWYEHDVVSWSNHNNMSDAYERMHKKLILNG